MICLLAITVARGCVEARLAGVAAPIHVLGGDDQRGSFSCTPMPKLNLALEIPLGGSTEPDRTELRGELLDAAGTIPKTKAASCSHAR
jgi:hypothetical protein